MPNNRLIQPKPCSLKMFWFNPNPGLYSNLALWPKPLWLSPNLAFSWKLIIIQTQTFHCVPKRYDSIQTLHFVSNIMIQPKSCILLETVMIEPKSCILFQTVLMKPKLHYDTTIWFSINLALCLKPYDSTQNLAFCRKLLWFNPVLALCSKTLWCNSKTLHIVSKPLWFNPNLALFQIIMIKPRPCTLYQNINSKT